MRHLLVAAAVACVAVLNAVPAHAQKDPCDIVDCSIVCSLPDCLLAKHCYYVNDPDLYFCIP